MGFRVCANVFLEEFACVTNGAEERDSGDEARELENRIVGPGLR